MLMENSNTPSPALSYALRSLTAREQTELMLRRKMKEKKLDPQETENAISYLKGNNYLSDSRYATMFIINAYECKKWGERRIFMELRQKGVDSELIKNLIEQYKEENETEDILYDLVEAKLNQDFDRKNREKAIRYFAYRGYSISEIIRTINTVISDNE